MSLLAGCFRLLVLKELIPLVSHFSQLRQELQAWLCDVTTDVEALDGAPGDLTPDTDDHAEQLRMRRYHVKVSATDCPSLSSVTFSFHLRVILSHRYCRLCWVCQQRAIQDN